VSRSQNDFNRFLLSVFNGIPLNDIEPLTKADLDNFIKRGIEMTHTPIGPSKP